MLLPLLLAMNIVGVVKPAIHPLEHTIQPAKSSMLTLAIVRPFTGNDASLMLNSMNDGSEAWSNICKNKESWDVVDLIFYYNKDLEAAPALKQHLEQVSQLPHLKRCFHNIRFISALLSEEEDGYPRGCCNQFFKLFLDNDMRETVGNYGSIFLMEPDVTPLQTGWLDKLYEHAQWAHNAGVWVTGPTYDSRDVPEDRRHWQSFTDGHINGNAIYKFDDQAYVDFLHDAYVHATQQCAWGDYDDKIWQFLYVNRPQLAHLFHQHDLIAHCKTNSEWDPRLTLTQARARYPSSILIHSQPLTDTNSSNVAMGH